MTDISYVFMTSTCSIRSENNTDMMERLKNNFVLPLEKYGKLVEVTCVPFCSECDTTTRFQNLQLVTFRCSERGTLQIHYDPHSGIINCNLTTPIGRASLIWHIGNRWTVLYVEYKEPTYIPNDLVVYQMVIMNVPEQNTKVRWHCFIATYRCMLVICKHVVIS